MISALPALKSAREELLEQLLEHGILRRTENQPVLSRDGTSARWMLDSLPVTLTPRGAELAGQLLLERLQRFDGTQLATFGLTAVPILQSAIVQSGGRYHGLLVRQDRKAHGSRKLIEGRIELEEPVIMIEDSIASGTSVSEGIARLEAAGLRVEGCVALVRFGWEGGYSDLCERGYHVETVYDIFADFMSRMEGEQGPDYNPTKDFPEFRWSTRHASNGLHPALLAREVLREYFTTGELLRPPSHLDADYDSSGGAWVSLRSREDIFDRHARDGFWHFPGEAPWGAAEDTVRAAMLTAREFPKGRDALELLDSSHIAVTYFSAMERVTVGELDNDRYGIVVVSGERPEIMGGALPNMPGIRDEWQQFRHARYNNADLYPYEPYVIYRHEVAKYPEPGAIWPPSGTPGTHEAIDLGSMAAWALELACGREPEKLFVQPALPASAAQIFVTIYIDGEVRGCMGAEVADLETNLRELMHAALRDERFDENFEDVIIDDDCKFAVSLSLLYNGLEMGDFSREEVRFRYRHGEQALMLEQGDRQGMLLPFVSSWLSLDAEDFVDEVIDKAGITRPPYDWRRFDCITWLADEGGTYRLDGGFKRCFPTLSMHDIARLHVEYLLRNQRLDGSFYFSYYAFENTLFQGIDAARQAHAAWILSRTGQTKAAAEALEYALKKDDDPALALSRDAFALLTLCEPGMSNSTLTTTLAEKLAASINQHGRITTWSPPVVAADTEPKDDEVDGEVDDDEEGVIDPEELQNYVPGQVLLALAAAARNGSFTIDRRVERAFRYYRHRFRYRRDFGQVSWMTLACSAWSLEERKKEWAALVFEIVDWILEFQNSQTGAFLTDHQQDTPGYTTGVYLEAVAAGIRVSEKFEPDRSHRYQSAWDQGFGFLDRLIIQERDSSVLPNAEYATGGLRENLYSGHVRIDFVQHSLAAILERYPDISPIIPKCEEKQNG